MCAPVSRWVGGEWKSKLVVKTQASWLPKDVIILLFPAEKTFFSRDF
jgi:hypothetical protein